MCDVMKIKNTVSDCVMCCCAILECKGELQYTI